MPINTSNMASTMYSAVRSTCDSTNADDINSAKKIGAKTQIKILTILLIGNPLSICCIQYISFPKACQQLHRRNTIHLVQTYVEAETVKDLKI